MTRTVMHDGDLCGLTWVKSTNWPERLTDRNTFISLADIFCGCGGITLGVVEAARRHGYGVRIALAVDKASDALGVYRRNFYVGPTIARDTSVESLFPAEIGAPLSEAEQKLHQSCDPVDLLVAGPPCQGHSDLNNSSRRTDPRNKLYLKAIRAVEVLRPLAFLIENVPTVVHDKWRVAVKAKDALTKLGYNCSEGIVNAAHVGLPQTRRRHLLIGVKSGSIAVTDCVEPWRGPMVAVSDYLSGLEDEPELRAGVYYTPSRPTAANRDRINLLFRQGIYDLPDCHRPPCHRDKEHSYVSMYGRIHWEKPSGTITSGFGSMGQGRFVHPTRPRMLTPHEAARVQGFPDFFDFSGVTKRTSIREMIANAVPPRLAAIVVDTMLSAGIFS